MLFVLNQKPSVANHFLAQLRDVNVQRDPMRFRRNLERLGELLGYELSKTLAYAPSEIETPLGVEPTFLLTQQPVLAAILRAGLPLHQGLLNYFDQSECAFVAAFRKHHKDGSFEISLQYVTCPPLEGRTLILCDPMLATGASIVTTIKELLRYGTPSSIHVVTAIAAADGVEHVRRFLPNVHIWAGAVDEELTAKSYIVPGLGDAGDLAYGPKMQD